MPSHQSGDLRLVGLPPTVLHTCRYRAKECANAVRLLSSLAQGTAAQGLRMGPRARSPLPTFLGRLDMDCCAIIGHSFGGATAGLLAAQDPAYHCAICLDPWWSVPLEQPFTMLPALWAVTSHCAICLYPW